MFILKNESDIPEKDKGFDVIACWHSVKTRLDCGLWILDSVKKKKLPNKGPKKIITKTNRKKERKAGA